MNNITLNREKGELIDGNNPSPEVCSSNRKLVETNDPENVSYVIACTTYQEETNARLQQEKTFEDLESSKDYLDKFIKINPMSDVILYKEVRQPVFIYEEA